MSFAAGTSRASRSRILAVGDCPLQIEDLEMRHLEMVANMYEAIGEIAASSAGAPIEMVIVDEASVSQPLEVIAESVHRLDPGVLVYLAVRNDVDDRARRRALAARFDGVLEAGDSSIEHRSAPQIPAGLPSPAAPERAAAPAAATTPIKAEPRARTSQPSRIDSHVPAASVQHRAPAVDTSFKAPASGLGDIDIVEAILDDPERGIETALALISQETGWRGLRFTSVEQADDIVSETAPVVLRGVTHGRLSAEGVSRASLEPWASWLARWAALASAQRDLWQMARCDALTGAWNRRYFDEFLPPVIETARQNRRQIPVMVFDVDNLKLFNDRHGHEAGDTVLRETVRLLQSIIRKGDQVFRIGGDEFVVVFADPDPPRMPGSGVIESVETIARRFQTEICKMKFPKLGPEAPGTLSISAGLATYPWDGNDADALVRVADQLALESKRGGKNALTIGPGAAAKCAPDGSAATE